jgi:filamentous hemagglutinin
MDAGVETAGAIQLAVGVALTAEQMAGLTQDIVWMVNQEVNGEKVLVPVVYLSAAHAQEVAQNGAILAGKSVVLDASGTLTNTGTIAASRDASLKAGTLLNAGNLTAGGDLSVTAAQDILNGGVIKGGNVNLAAGGDILSTADMGRLDGSGLKLGDAFAPIDAARLGLAAGGGISASGNLAATAGRDLTLDKVLMTAGGDLSLSAKRDVALTAAGVTAGGDAQLVAGRDITLGATSQTTAVQGGMHGSERTEHAVSTISAGGSAVLAAGRDLSSEGAQLNADQQVAISAGRDVILNAVTDTYRNEGYGKDGKKAVQVRTTDEVLAGTSLDGKEGVIVSAGHDIRATAAMISSDMGGVALAARNDVSLDAGQEMHAWEQQTKSVKSGSMSSTTKKAFDASVDKLAVGTLISGDTVTVAAGHDITTRGAQVGATGDVVMAAGNNLTVGAAETTHGETHNRSVEKSGLMSGGGFSVMIGGSKEQTGYEQTDSTPTGSLLGSTDGKVVLTAGNTLHVTASDVLSKKGTTMVGRDVTIDAAVATTDTQQTYKKQTAGITLGLTGGVVDAAAAAYGTAHRGDEVRDDRLKALYAAKTAYAISDGINAYQAAVNSTGGADGGVSLRIGIGASSASSETKTHEERAYGSSIRSDADITIVATGGDLSVVGSHVEGRNVALAAAKNLNLLSQEETHSSKSTNRNGSGEVGFSVGSQTGIYVSASAGRGKAVGNGVTHAETNVGASENLTVVSGNDATIKGAQLKGGSVVGTIGGNLLILSEQDTDDYASKQQQASATVTFGYGGSGSFNQSKATSHYESVNEVSGIAAGAGGFQLVVGGNTYLIGGVIASEADASKNYLSTGSLTWEALSNEASYKSRSIGAGGGFSTGKSGDDGASNSFGTRGVSGSPNLGLSQKGRSGSDTESSVASGSIVVRDGPVDLSALDRAGSFDTQALKPIFDEKAVAERQEMAQVAGQVGFRAAGDVGEAFGLKEGSREKIALHGAVAAAMASLGAGSVGSAVAGSTANQLAINALANSLQDAGYVSGSPEFATLMKFGSSALGLTVGGEAGGVVAISATANNWLLHSEVEKADKAIAECRDQACKDNVISSIQALSDLRDRELFEWNRTVQNTASEGAMSYSDYTAAVNAYWTVRGIEKNQVVVEGYGPAHEVAYTARQFASGLTAAARDFPSKVTSEVSASLGYLRDRGLSGSAEDLRQKLTDAAHGLSAWYSGSLPSQSVERTIDQYALTSPYRFGEVAFDHVTGLATAYVGGKAVSWIGGKWVAKTDASSGKGSTISNDVLDKPRVGSGEKGFGSGHKTDEIKSKIVLNAEGNRISVYETIGQDGELVSRPPFSVQEFPSAVRSHGFTDIVDNYAGAAQKFQLSNGSTLYQIEGSLNGTSGRFEWINDPRLGGISHRMFVPNGVINGKPIKP